MTIKVPKKFETVPGLEIAMMPFFPEQQLALGYAKKQIQANRKYQGYLPFGEYTIAGSTFTVAQGDTSTVVVVKPEGSSSAVASGPTEPTGTASDGIPLRLDLGFSAANAGESGVVGEALAFGGVGTRLGVGTSFELQTAWHWWLRLDTMVCLKLVKSRRFKVWPILDTKQHQRCTMVLSHG